MRHLHVAGRDDAKSLDDHIRRIVDQAPPLTAEQRDQLVVLLRPPPDPRGQRAA